MPKFKYTAIDQKGKQKTGNVDASNPEEARTKVSSMGLMPVREQIFNRFLMLLIIVYSSPLLWLVSALSSALGSVGAWE